jgi:hypothetical protein
MDVINLRRRRDTLQVSQHVRCLKMMNFTCKGAILCGGRNITKDKVPFYVHYKSAWGTECLSKWRVPWGDITSESSFHMLSSPTWPHLNFLSKFSKREDFQWVVPWNPIKGLAVGCTRFLTMASSRSKMRIEKDFGS